MNDVIRDILTGVGTAAAVGAFTLIIGIRDNVRKNTQTLYGETGNNGLRKRVMDLERDAKSLNEWKIREDTLEKVEREMLSDSGRRPERLRDKIQHPDLGE
jgi:hypothetical protein